MVKWFFLMAMAFVSFWYSLFYGGPAVIKPTALFTDSSDIHFLNVIRLPRTLLVFLSGSALAMAGAISQSIFRNPMAEPAILGIQSVSAFCSVLIISLGLSTFGLWTVPVFSAAGASLLTFFLLLFHNKTRSIDLTLLTGVAFSLLFGALTTLVLSISASNYQIGNKLLNWLMGDFEGRGWEHLKLMAFFVLPALFFQLKNTYGLDLLHLGEDTAASLGLPVASFYRNQILLLAVIIGTVTALCGSIGFLGLIVPHILRPTFGAFHRPLLYSSAILGGAVLVIVDSLNRVITSINLPPGAFLSLIGAPFFLWLLFYYHPGHKSP